jgi:protein-S-isoprenylcysteine O-methyltransferase Ste14
MEMVISQLIIGTLYTAIILSLIWARFRFFKIKTKQSKLVSYLNDPAVLIQLVFTYGLLWQSEYISITATVLVTLCYVSSLVLFWWAIKTAGALDFASSEAKGQVLTTGAFGLVRHPFYLSYILVWVSSSALFDSVYLWLSSTVLVCLYILSAKQEEASILKSESGESYATYKLETGMFLPKV